MQSRTEQQGEANYETVWTFRVERYDEAGNRVLLVPVEMRGYAFEGAISEGDWVRAHGKMKKGTLRASEVENLTSGAGVNAKTMPKAAIIAFSVFFAAVFAFVIWGFFQTMSG
ncbi:MULTISPECIES: hypothetical protein [unclassified Streptomyces]|uniref:hypothetical protein n=1 Tax=unclassified Streptomyces TaxID=2593676 RepID=UPI0007ECAF10|nr:MULTISPECIES: hypothetical protein [unclassified Streptomyces]MCP3770708.1 DUF2259 domain-containing protein [Streptomyces sp. MAR25Y5]OBQ54304.1 hypothetical protein A4U61_00345 [Streptomyces sp. H-KF8]